MDTYSLKRSSKRSRTLAQGLALKGFSLAANGLSLPLACPYGCTAHHKRSELYMKCPGCFIGCDLLLHSHPIASPYTAKLGEAETTRRRFAPDDEATKKKEGKNGKNCQNMKRMSGIKNECWAACESCSHLKTQTPGWNKARRRHAADRLTQ